MVIYSPNVQDKPRQYSIGLGCCLAHFACFWTMSTMILRSLLLTASLATTIRGSLGFS